VHHPWERSLAELVAERFGFQLGEHGKNVLPLIERRLSGRGEAPEAWLERLGRAGPADPELRWLVEAFTIGETTFGRDPEQLSGVQQVMVERHRALGRPLQVWSAACATGEEAFTLAILLAEASVPGAVLGTDLNEGSLQVARTAGPYSSYRLMPVPPDWQAKWFVPSGGGWTVAPTLRRQVQLQRHNLLDAAPAVAGGFDLIVCRNVLIYFSPETVDAVVGRLLGALHPDGVLFLGAGDPLSALRQPLRKLRLGLRTAYQRPAPPSTPAHSAAPGLRSTASNGPATPAGAPTPGQGGGHPDPAALERARSALGARDLRSAAALLDLHLRAQPADAEALSERGALRLSQHDFVGARVDLEAAVARAPQRADAHYLLGVAHLKQRADALAAAAFEAALRSERRHWPAMVLLAGVRQSQGQLLHAELHYRKAVELMKGPQPLSLTVRAAGLVSSAHSSLRESCEVAIAELDSLQRAQLRAPTP
jgi:chemotaxis protein methyltransferase CheR